MKYAGFWVRLLAGLCDLALLLPAIPICWWLISQSYMTANLAAVLSSTSGALFSILFLGRYGQTPGKMIAHIRVARLDGGRIGYREAALRHSIDMLLGLLYAAGWFAAIHKTGPDAWTAEHTWRSLHHVIAGNFPRSYDVWSVLAEVWMWSEMVVLMLNAKRRALHDFLAGTVVIHVEREGHEA